MKINLKATPIKIIPLKAQPLVPMGSSSTKLKLPPEQMQTLNPSIGNKLKQQSMTMGQGLGMGMGVGMIGGKGKTLPDAGHQPEPTRQQIENYRQNHEKIVGPIVIKSLRQHRQDVLHGSRSLQMIIPGYSRQPKDWDLYSPTEKTRALALEASIDRKVGADIASTEYVPIPKVTMGPDEPGTSKELYRVVTPDVSNDPEIDVMDRPVGLQTMSHSGITHEELGESFIKARRRIRTQPIKAGKAVEDAREIQRYYESKGRKLPEYEQSQGVYWRKMKVI